jgi:hypothetical protein
MAEQDNKIPMAKKLKERAIELSEYVDKVISRDKEKKAVLLCEGNFNSIDYMIYKEIYTEFVVIPSDGCTDIRKLMPFMKKYCEYATYGIIDRDNNSKKRIRNLVKDHNIFSTKLPFVENIVCCPEVLKILSRIRGCEYSEVIGMVRKTLASLLTEKLSLLNPFNVDIPKDCEVELVSIMIVTKNSAFQKNIDLVNIMYTFRDKAIVGAVADALGLNSKEAYLKFLSNSLNGEYRDKILSAMAKYLPAILLEE